MRKKSFTWYLINTAFSFFFAFTHLQAQQVIVLSNADLELLYNEGWELYFGRKGERIDNFFISENYTHIIEDHKKEEYFLVKVYNNHHLLEKQFKIKRNYQWVYMGIPDFSKSQAGIVYGPFNFKNVVINGTKIKRYRVQKTEKQFPLNYKEDFFYNRRIYTTEYSPENGVFNYGIFIENRKEPLFSDSEKMPYAKISKGYFRYDFLINDSVLYVLENREGFIWKFSKDLNDSVRINLTAQSRLPLYDKFIDAFAIKPLIDSKSGQPYLFYRGKNILVKINELFGGSCPFITIDINKEVFDPVNIHDGYVYMRIRHDADDTEYIYRKRLIIKQ